MPRKTRSPSKQKVNTRFYQRTENRKEAGTGECLGCGKTFQKRGLVTHQNACLLKAKKRLDFENLDPPDFTHSLPDHLLQDINVNAGQSSRVTLEDLDPEGSNEDASGMDSKSHSSESSELDSPMDVDNEGWEDVPFDEGQGDGHIERSEETQSPSEPYTTPSAWIRAANEDNPEDNTIRVEYHETSERPVEHFTLDQYLDKISSSAASSSPNALSEDDDEPWNPFSSRIDFKLGKLMLETHMNAKQIDELLSLIRLCVEKPQEFTLQDNKHLSLIWDTARARGTSFKQKTMSIPYPKTNPRTNLEYDMWYKPLWDWCDELLSDRDIVSQFRWDAERVYKFDAKNEKFERWIDEPWTAEAWWNVQSRLPKGGHPFCIILYADKTQLSSFGTAKGYPVLARCANLPADIRNGKGRAGGRLVGWLPIVKEDSGETGKKEFVNLKRIVWHEGFKEILESIVERARTGFYKECGDDIWRLIFPIILILSADYEEQCVMSLIRGLGSTCPCPVCLVPTAELSNLQPTEPWTRRTTKDMQDIYNEAQTLPPEEKEALLQSVGLRDIENVFWSLEHTDVYSAIAWDRLHAYHGGLFSDHLWVQFKEVVGALKKPKKAAKQIDLQVAQIPRWSGLYHFSEIMKAGEYTDGRKYEDMSKIIIFASHNLLSSRISKRGYILLQLMRSYLELDMYTSLTVQTETTIDEGRREMVRFNAVLKRYQQIHKEKNWNFIKCHSHGHFFDDARNRGASKNYNTKPNESAHRPLKKFYLHHTNFKNVDPQVLRLNEISVIAQTIQEAIDAADNAASQNDRLNDPEADSEDNIGTESTIAHISVGSPLQPTYLSQIEQDHMAQDPQDLAFTGFRRKAIMALRNIIANDPNVEDKSTVVLPTLRDDLQITPFQYIKVNFVSVINWEITTDILRTNPRFYNRPRYDYALLYANSDEFIFAQLLYTFGITFNGSTHYMALILPMDVPIIPSENPYRQTDQDLRFRRLQARPRSSAAIVSLETIVRGALLIDAYGCKHNNEYIVMDVVDADMWWRMKSIKLARSKVKF